MKSSATMVRLMLPQLAGVLRDGWVYTAAIAAERHAATSPPPECTGIPLTREFGFAFAANWCNYVFFPSATAFIYCIVWP